MEMTLQDHYDVIIVGGGPAGSACATMLAQHGIEVLVCEKATFPRGKICGECINPRCWPLLEMLGAEETVRKENPRIIECVGIYAHDSREIRFQLSGNGAPFLAMTRSLFDSLLLQNAMRLGAKVIQGSKVVSVSHKGRWEILVSNGTMRIVKADYLVGADGRNSIVASALAAGKTLRRRSERIGIQWHTAFQPLLGNDLQMFLFPGGYFGTVNVSNDMANIAMVITPEFAQIANTDFPLFMNKTVFANHTARTILRHLKPLATITVTSPINPFIHHSNHPFAFLVGDARRTVEPFTGEGILFALEDGIRTALQLVERITGKRNGTSLPRMPRPWVHQVLSIALRNPSFGSRLFSACRSFPYIQEIGIRSILGKKSLN